MRLWVDMHDLTASTVAMMWIKLLGASSIDLKNLHWHLPSTIYTFVWFTNIGPFENFNNQNFNNKNSLFCPLHSFWKIFWIPYSVFDLLAVPEWTQNVEMWFWAGPETHYFSFTGEICLWCCYFCQALDIAPSADDGHMGVGLIFCIVAVVQLLPCIVCSKCLPMVARFRNDPQFEWPNAHIKLYILKAQPTRRLYPQSTKRTRTLIWARIEVE